MSEEKRTKSITVSRKEAAFIIGVSGQQVDNYVKSGELTNIGDTGRYKRPLFLRSQCEKLANPNNRKREGRPFGWRKAG